VVEDEVGDKHSLSMQFFDTSGRYARATVTEDNSWMTSWWGSRC